MTISPLKTLHTAYLYALLADAASEVHEYKLRAKQRRSSERIQQLQQEAQAKRDRKAAKRRAAMNGKQGGSDEA